MINRQTAISPLKREVLRWFVQQTCPACRGRKNRYHWLCLVCQQAVQNTPERARCAVACMQHVEAVAEMVERQRKTHETQQERHVPA